jgi:tRNA A-37 threonylcarbamoyl transferase component Bud32
MIAGDSDTMDECPFQLEVQRTRPLRAERLTCIALLRAVPGTRYVYDAMWNDRQVVVKVFCRRLNARRHLRREWRGWKRLEMRQLNAPKPLFCGRTSGGWAAVTEKIENAHNASALWDQCGTIEQKTDLLCRISGELARLHRQGAVQTDMHLGNFLVRDDEVFVLDPAMMRFRSGEVGRSRAIGQLARLVSILNEEETAVADDIVAAYARARGWSWQRQDLSRLRAMRRRRRSRAIERGLRKFLRNNRRHQVIRGGGWRGIAERVFFEAAGIDALSSQLDDAMQAGQICKDGRTSFVARTDLGGVDVVVKRYNHKGWIHSLRHTIKRSRARRSWVNGHRLCLLGISTPRPLAYVERWKGPLVWCSYIVTEYVAGGRVSDLLRDKKIGAKERRERITEVEDLLRRLGDLRISHGDVKHSNILIGRDGPVLTDLDAITVHRWRWTSEVRHRKDMDRFAASCSAEIDRLR